MFADINNFTNLLNKNWGGLRQVSPTFNDAVAGVVQVQCLAAATPTGTAATGVVANTTSQPCVQYRYSSFAQPTDNAVNITQSLYTIRIGARFTF